MATKQTKQNPAGASDQPQDNTVTGAGADTAAAPGGTTAADAAVGTDQGTLMAGTGESLQSDGAAASAGAPANAVPGLNQAGASSDEPRKLPYLVNSVPIRHDGEYYTVDTVVRLTDAEAARLGPLVTLILLGASDED